MNQIACNQPSIDPIGLASHSHGMRVMAKIAGIENVNQHAARMRQLGQPLVIASSRLHRDLASRRQLGQPGVDCAGLVGYHLLRPTRKGDLQKVLGDINTDLRWAWHGASFVVRYAMPGWSPTNVSLYPNRRSKAQPLR